MWPIVRIGTCDDKVINQIVRTSTSIELKADDAGDTRLIISIKVDHSKDVSGGQDCHGRILNIWISDLRMFSPGESSSGKIISAEGLNGETLSAFLESLEIGIRRAYDESKEQLNDKQVAALLHVFTSDYVQMLIAKQVEIEG